jgi:hypothetical protein
VSSDFDFFAGQRAASAPAVQASPWAPAAPPASPWAPPAPSTAAVPVDQRFGSPVGAWQTVGPPGVGQFAPAARSSRRPLIAVALLAVVAIAGGAFYMTTRPHPIALPATLADLPKLSISSAQAHGLDSAKHGLANDGLHEVSFGVYGTLSAGQPGLVVIAGRTSSNAPDFNQLATAMSQAGQFDGISVTPQTLTSGATTLQCATITAQGESVPLCAWQGTHAVLFGIGQDLSAQDTADALELARLDASLH